MSNSLSEKVWQTNNYMEAEFLQKGRNHKFYHNLLFHANNKLKKKRVLSIPDKGIVKFAVLLCGGGSYKWLLELPATQGS